MAKQKEQKQKVNTYTSLWTYWFTISWEGMLEISLIFSGVKSLLAQAMATPASTHILESTFSFPLPPIFLFFERGASSSMERAGEADRPSSRVRVGVGVDEPSQ